MKVVNLIVRKSVCGRVAAPAAFAKGRNLIIRLQGFSGLHMQDLTLAVLKLPLREVNSQFVFAGPEIEKAITLRGVGLYGGGDESWSREPARLARRSVGAQDLNDDIRNGGSIEGRD